MRANRKRIATAITALAIGGALLTGCGDKMTEPYKDAPRAGKVLEPKWTVIAGPDGFSNQATACLQLADGSKPGIRLFTMYHGDHAYGDVNQLVDESCK